MTKTLAALEKFTHVLEPVAPCSLQAAARAAETNAEQAAASQQASLGSDGVTRKGGRGEGRWLMGLAVLALTIGLGFGFGLVVRVGGWAGQRSWSQGARKSHPHSQQQGTRSHPLSAS